MTKIIAENEQLLKETFVEMTEEWRVNLTWEYMATEFVLRLAMRGIFWPVYKDDYQEDISHKSKLIRNYLTSARRGPEWVVKSRKTTLSKYSEKDITQAVAMQQHLCRKLMREHNITSHTLIKCEDETFLKSNGNLIGRTLARGKSTNKVGKQARVASNTEEGKGAGWMLMTVATMDRGIDFFCYVPLTDNMWRNQPDQHYRVKRIYEGVYTLNVPPGGKITQGRHIKALRSMHSQSSVAYLHVYDNAGPHQAKACELAILSFNGIACAAPKGGHSGVSQLPDDKRVHGGLKAYVRRKAVAHFLDEARASEGKRPKGIPLKILLQWVGEWRGAYGRPEDIAPLFKEYFPPCNDGDDDCRKPDILGRVHE